MNATSKPLIVVLWILVLLLCFHPTSVGAQEPPASPVDTVAPTLIYLDYTAVTTVQRIMLASFLVHLPAGLEPIPDELLLKWEYDEVDKEYDYGDLDLERPETDIFDSDWNPSLLYQTDTGVLTADLNAGVNTRATWTKTFTRTDDHVATNYNNMSVYVDQDAGPGFDNMLVSVEYEDPDSFSKLVCYAYNKTIDDWVYMADVSTVGESLGIMTFEFTIEKANYLGASMHGTYDLQVHLKEDGEGTAYIDDEEVKYTFYVGSPTE